MGIKKGMEEQEGPRGFKIDFTDKEPDSAVKEPAPAEKQLEKAPGPGNRAVRTVFIWLLTMVVVLGVFFFGYRHLHTRIVEIESMGDTGFEGLSGKIDERLTAISELAREQRNQIGNRLREAENKAGKNAEAIEDIRKTLGNVENRLPELETSLKGRIDKLENSTAETNSEITSQINQQTERIDRLAATAEEVDNLKSGISETSKKMQGAESKIEALDRQISAMQQERINAEEIEQNLEQKSRDISRSLGQQIESETENIRSRLNKINDRMDGLEAMINVLEDMQKSKGQQNSGSKDSSDTSREIIEQELK
ncbi:MAG: hypothetical protein ACLFUN_06600 [Desulfobacterales bacterium]